jgi:hypothetical protein
MLGILCLWTLAQALAQSLQALCSLILGLVGMRQQSFAFGNIHSILYGLHSRSVSRVASLLLHRLGDGQGENNTLVQHQHFNGPENYAARYLCTFYCYWRSGARNSYFLQASRTLHTAMVQTIMQRKLYAYDSHSLLVAESSKHTRK